MEQGGYKMNNLLTNRELTEQEKEKRRENINSYLLKHSGVIIAISCKDGILLAGSNSQENQSIFPVFHRIGLLGIGRLRDCKDMHKYALRLALGKELAFSKADIDTQEITEGISEELEKSFSYLRSVRGLYQANFITAELGFERKNDYLGLALFDGRSKLQKITKGINYRIYEIPQLKETKIITLSDPAKSQKNSKAKKNSKTANYKKKNPNEKQKVTRIIRKIYHLPATKHFRNLINSINSSNKPWSVKEAAFFVGILLSFLNSHEGKLEMAYLDRNKLEKTNLGERRFYSIWRKVTSPNPYKPSDSWEDWEKFVAPVRRGIKKGKIYSEFKEFVELLDILKKENPRGINNHEKEIIKNIERKHKKDLFKKIFNPENVK